MFTQTKSMKFGALAILMVCGAVLFTYVTSDNNMPQISEEAHEKPDTSETLTNTSKSAGMPSDLPGVEKTDTGFEFDESMKLKLQQISEAYEEQIQYPEFSKPIKEGELESKYLSDIPVANELPAKLSDPTSPVLSIKTNQLRYFYGDNMTAVASISGLSVDEYSEVNAQLVSDGQVLAYASVTPMADVVHGYHLDFNALQFEDVDWKRELTVDTEFKFSGNVYQRSTSVEYIRSIASIDQVAASEVQEDFLEIPVHISTQKPGYHRVRANLYDAETGAPLVHLRAEELVDSTSGTLVLKAHISALKQSGSEGPYELKDLSLQRLPSKPDFITEFGRVEQASFSVEGYSFSEYQDKPYINEKAQRIAKELRRLGS